MPAIKCSGLPGKRDELHRAGIMPTALFIPKIDNDVCRSRQIFRDPIGAATVGHFIETAPDANRPHAGVTAAFDVDFLVADKKRTRKIGIVVASGLQNHSRGRLAAFRRDTRNVRTKIGRLDQAVAELAQHFRFDRAVLLHCEKTAADPAWFVMMMSL